MLKRLFSKTENIKFLLQKKFYDAEILYGARHLNCRWKIDKINKKLWRKKSHAEDRTQILTKLTAKFKFLIRPQKLVQNNNWCSMVYIFIENKKVPKLFRCSYVHFHLTDLNFFVSFCKKILISRHRMDRFWIKYQIWIDY